MAKIKHICFLVPNYPTEKDPIYTFVRELICEIADTEIKCSVIAPQSITNFFVKKWRKRPFKWDDITKKNNIVEIYQPISANFLKLNIFGNKLSALLTEYAMKRAFNKLIEKPDILYAHFWHTGVVAGSISNKNNIPFFVATGESKIWVNKLYKNKKINKAIQNVKGVIAVSTKNKEESIDLDLSTEEKIKVIPNSINNNLFYSIDKKKARKSLGLNQNDFIVAFTGSFTHRKGVLRLSEAIDSNPGIKGIFIGSGELEPKSENIVFKGKLPHKKIVYYLNAADVFVLPTLAEGCCNAIIEAMACGLPIVSSHLSFNDDILNNRNSIRIDSNSINEISNAITHLKNNPQICSDMSSASLKIAKELEINERVKKILEFINNKL